MAGCVTKDIQNMFSVCRYCGCTPDITCSVSLTSVATVKIMCPVCKTSTEVYANNIRSAIQNAAYIWNKDV
jgi:hypothetical protein